MMWGHVTCSSSSARRTFSRSSAAFFRAISFSSCCSVMACAVRELRRELRSELRWIAHLLPPRLLLLPLGEEAADQQLLLPLDRQGQENEACEMQELLDHLDSTDKVLARTHVLICSVITKGRCIFGNESIRTRKYDSVE